MDDEDEAEEFWKQDEDYVFKCWFDSTLWMEWAPQHTTEWTLLGRGDEEQKKLGLDYIRGNMTNYFYSFTNFRDEWKMDQIVRMENNLNVTTTELRSMYDKEVDSGSGTRWGKNSTRPESCRKFVESSIFQQKCSKNMVEMW